MMSYKYFWCLDDTKVQHFLPSSFLSANEIRSSLMLHLKLAVPMEIRIIRQRKVET